MKVYVKNIKRKKGEFQFYMHQFVEACIRQNITPVSEQYFCIRFKLSGLMMKLGHRINFFRWRKDKAVIVCASGGDLMYMSFPYNLFYEIIPVFWDSWPFNWQEQIYSLKRLRCKVCFVTSSQVAQKMRETLPYVKVFWLPEGIDVTDYKCGACLVNRNIEVYEFGRQQADFHNILSELKSEGFISNFMCNEYDKNGMTVRLAFPTSRSLLNALPDIKIVISFPQIDTHPERVGDIETLTQRYWEAMLSRNLIIGRAPAELIQLIGYNPIIEVDWVNPKKQVLDILSNIQSYQKLVDKNYQIAVKISSWDNRVKDIILRLKDLGYEV